MKPRSAAPLLSGLLVLVSGCTVLPSTAEKQARTESTRLGQVLHGADQPLPAPHAPLADYLRYAVLRHPQVLAAYSDWQASVLAIAPTRALPDPQLTFEADVTDTLMTFMPGLMFDFMTPGKRRAMADEMTAASSLAYRNYVATVLRTAADVRKAWVELAYADEALNLRQASLRALAQSQELAQIDYTTGRGMGTLSESVRLSNDLAKVRSDIAVLEDRQRAARTRFKSALGLKADETDPAWPEIALIATVLPDEGELWRRTSASNAGLAQMRAMADMARASIEVAKKAKTPDFAVGAMADFKADPLMVRPTASVTLPIWREKIAANIAAAEARRDASVARVSAEEINLAAELAQMLYMVREADQMIRFIEQTALPGYERVIATAEAAYQSGMGSPAMIPESRLMAINMRIERLSALRERELAVTDLLLMTADIAPTDSPLSPKS
ncbi:MAG TPA: TolC family protein [Lacunisphaera sp.]|nr:TolC family protein [Lacunisphaera sp.]